MKSCAVVHMCCAVLCCAVLCCAVLCCAVLVDIPVLCPVQIIVKEKGVFSNVTSPSTKAKLRLLFEVAPLALLVSQPQSAYAQSLILL